MARTIETPKGTALIRGNYSVAELKGLFASFQRKYNSAMRFEEWLAARGKIYYTIPRKAR